MNNNNNNNAIGGSGSGGPAGARTRRQALGSAMCMGILAVILLLTFLIPRSPSVALSGGAVELSGAPIYVNASFELHNRNWYRTTFKDLRFGLYTLDETGVGQIGTAYFPGPIDVKARRE
jgi:multisubunit Na+/H+ antiporter MnhB subunit